MLLIFVLLETVWGWSDSFHCVTRPTGVSVWTSISYTCTNIPSSGEIYIQVTTTNNDNFHIDANDDPACGSIVSIYSRNAGDPDTGTERFKSGGTCSGGSITMTIYNDNTATSAYFDVVFSVTDCWRNAFSGGYRDTKCSCVGDYSSSSCGWCPSNDPISGYNSRCISGTSGSNIDYSTASCSSGWSESCTTSEVEDCYECLLNGYGVCKEGGTKHYSCMDGFSGCDTDPDGYYNSLNCPSASKKFNGKSCSSGSDCLSNICSSGICCTTSCNDYCSDDVTLREVSCSTGRCLVTSTTTCSTGNHCSLNQCVSGCTKDSHCTASQYCSGSGTCENKKNNGEACPSNMGKECTSGNCVDGTCCMYSSCWGALCNGNTLVQAETCSSGTCVSPGQSSCELYICSSGACQQPCSSGSDCISGYYCQSGTCLEKKTDGSSCSSNSQCQSTYCVEGICCDQLCNGKTCNTDRSTIQSCPSGTCIDTTTECGVYKCSGGECLSQCSDDDDCKEGFECKDNLCIEISADNKVITEEKGKTGIVVGSSVGGGIILVAGIAGITYWLKKRKGKDSNFSEL